MLLWRAVADELPHPASRFDAGHLYHPRLDIGEPLPAVGALLPFNVPEHEPALLQRVIEHDEVRVQAAHDGRGLPGISRQLQRVSVDAQVIGESTYKPALEGAGDVRHGLQGMDLPLQIIEILRRRSR